MVPVSATALLVGAFFRDDERQLGLALAQADTDEPERVDEGDDERKAVGSGDGGQANEEGVIDLGDAEQIPGQAGDARAGEFHGDPKEWREQKRGLEAEPGTA